jgi:UTP--glucose-1-phosphate uridylyltransferase
MARRYDIGNKLDYLKTTVDFALKRKEFADDFAAYLRENTQGIR